jgi:hypothetical protein
VYEGFQAERRNYEQVLHEENRRFFMIKLQRELRFEAKKKEAEESRGERERELVEQA